MIKILIAGEHTIFREGLKQILLETNDIVVTAIAANGQDLLNKIRKNDFDVLVLDIAMPVSSSLAVLKELKSQKLKLPIIVLSMYPEEQYALWLLRAGADGYLSKESSPKDVIMAIRIVYAGKKYISPYLLEQLALGLDEYTAKPPHELLSHLEYQVLCQIASSKSVKEIADELSLNFKAVSTHRAKILKKMGMRNNSELTHYAIQNHLVDLKTDSP